MELIFLRELKRRSVFRVAAAYAGASWFLVHVGTVLGESFEPLHKAMPTVIGVLFAGLPLVLLGTWFFGLTPGGFKLRHRVAGVPSTRDATARKLELIIMIVLALTVAAMLADRWLLRRPADETVVPVLVSVILAMIVDHLIGRPSPRSAAATSTSSRAIQPLPSIAVLPFANLTGDAGKDYLGDGMAEELIHMLTRVPGLKVPARTSSFAYKGKDTDIRQIARDLGVETVLEGSVRSAGERIRVTAQLVNAQTGFDHWSESYDRCDEDIFKLEEEIGSAILHALQVNLSGKPPAAVLPEPPTPNAEAYQFYIQGRALAQLAGLDSAQAGIRLLQKSVATDPNFARGYSELARAQVYLLPRRGVTASRLSEIERNAQRALALDPEDSQAYACLSSVSVHRGQWLDAERHCRKALTLNPADPSVLVYYSGTLLPATGRLRAALHAAQEARRLAPAMPLAAIHIAIACAHLGQDSDVLANVQLAADLGMSRSTIPLPFLEAAVATNARRYAEAAELMNSVLAPSVLDAGGAAVVRLVYAALGGAANKRAAIEALQTLRAGAAREVMAGTTMMMLSTYWFTRLGALDLAYELAHVGLHELETTGVLRGAIAVQNCWLPDMRPFRMDPRFQPYVEQLGLMDFWRRHGPPDDCDLKDGRLICH